ncbi:hypothetical protein BKA70DRAFT_1430341 [Coprinopsis sp. MPI-PUGE-AT-0042]|nr:hypothetical protein BKA70DRAFT_1430341 [Coprinopsis sp. MPI-PUGE-AT-0042]
MSVVDGGPATQVVSSSVAAGMPQQPVAPSTEVNLPVIPRTTGRRTGCATRSAIAKQQEVAAGLQQVPLSQAATSDMLPHPLSQVPRVNMHVDGADSGIEKRPRTRTSGGEEIADTTKVAKKCRVSIQDQATHTRPELGAEPATEEDGHADDKGSMSSLEADIGEYDITDPFIDDADVEGDETADEDESQETTLETEGASEDEYAEERMDTEDCGPDPVALASKEKRKRKLRKAIQIGLDEAAARDAQSEEEEAALNCIYEDKTAEDAHCSPGPETPTKAPTGSAKNPSPMCGRSQLSIVILH